MTGTTQNSLTRNLLKGLNGEIRNDCTVKDCTEALRQKHGQNCHENGLCFLR